MKIKKFFGVMIERRVFPPDGQSLFDLELEGGASLVNHVQVVPIDGLAELRTPQVLTSLRVFIRYEVLITDTDEKCRKVSP